MSYDPYNPQSAGQQSRWAITIGLLLALILVALVASTSAMAEVQADCPDNDGDNYVVSDGSCTIPDGKLPGDCNDANSAINPAAAELCGDGVDNNCNGQIDEGFIVGQESPASTGYDCTDGLDNDGDTLVDYEDPQCMAAACQLDQYGNSPPACDYPPNPLGSDTCALTSSFAQCSADGLSTVCPVPPGGKVLPQAEVPYTGSCHDGADNDYDGLADGADSDCMAVERCNGLDDNFVGGVDEGFNVGVACDNGEVGYCAAQGVFVCSDNGMESVCSAPVKLPKTEGPFGDGTCSDGIDNDCDGDTDFAADLSCRAAEICDGIDNDGNGQIDETFADLGQACGVGVGVCAASGVNVCSPGGSGVMCSAAPNLGGPEGPIGPTCSDNLDNDCDGLTDAADPDCGSAQLGAYCSLAYLNGRPGRDCTGWHDIQFGATNAGANASVVAELMALDSDGNLIESRVVGNGDDVHLASRIDPSDYKFTTQVLPKGTRHQVFAPIPIMRVTVQDGLNTAQAFCSNIPYLDVVEPSGGVVSESEGDVTRVVVALPNVNLKTLGIKVDGVDIVAGLGLTPATAFPGGPYNGTVMIGGNPVEVIDLTVRGDAIGVHSSNSLTMRLSGLGCGGHIVLVTSAGPRPGAFPPSWSDQCFVDDYGDTGLSNGLSVDISAPTEGQIVAVFPVQVSGEACSGTPIAGVRVNGKRLDVAGNVTYTPGNGVDSGDLYEYPISTLLPKTDLAAELTTGQAQIGTLDPGSNRLIAEVTDEQGNRSFDNVFFAVGEVAEPSVGPLPPSNAAHMSTLMPDDDMKVQIVKTATLDTIKELATQQVKESLEATSTDIENAFVVGLKPEAIQKVFDARCAEVAQQFVDTVRGKILAVPPITKKLSGGCSCDPDVTIRITGVQADPNQMSCPVTFTDGKIDVTVHLPDLSVTGKAYGRCETTFLGACVAETIVDVTSTTTIENIGLTFSVTENQLMGNLGANPVFVEGSAIVNTTGGSEVNCLASVCNWAIEGLVTILSFGQAELDLTPQIDISQEVDFSREIGASEPDPIELDEIKVDEQQVDAFGQQLRGDLLGVEITPNGLRATLTGQFATLMVDPEVVDTPGAALTPADPPDIHPSNAEDVYLSLADDTFNQLFASMTASGKLKTSCQDSNLTFSSLLPADCEAIDVPGNSTLTNVLQGTCHGFKGDNCSTIPTTGLGIVEKGACTNAQAKLQSLNISASTPLLLCVKQDNPPNFLIQDVSNTGPVETVIRLNDLSVAVVLDRNGDGYDGGQISTVSNCLDPNASGSTAGDCLGYGMCLDLNLLSMTQFETCSDGNPGLATQINAIQITDRISGMVCGGVPPADDDLLAQSAADSDPVTIDLTENVEDFAPPICAAGLDLGGYTGGLDVNSLKVFAIDAAGGQSSPFQDYLGITGNVQP